MVGIKTGFTRDAGRCLIARVVREEGDVLLVMLNAPRRWWAATALLTHAFDTLARTRLQRDAPSPVPDALPDSTGGPVPL
jgi:D-alanyl-D-alanine carboxypeptidase (penicillin-binding protein 5/6)